MNEIDKTKLEDSEREEGEIVDISEFENISSDEEENTLRNRILELEARNIELEKINSLSSRSYGLHNLGTQQRKRRPKKELSTETFKRQRLSSRTKTTTTTTKSSRRPLKDTSTSYRSQHKQRCTTSPKKSSSKFTLNHNKRKNEKNNQKLQEKYHKTKRRNKTDKHKEIHVHHRPKSTYTYSSSDESDIQISRTQLAAALKIDNHYNHCTKNSSSNNNNKINNKKYEFNNETTKKQNLVNESMPRTSSSSEEDENVLKLRLEALQSKFELKMGNDESIVTPTKTLELEDEVANVSNNNESDDVDVDDVNKKKDEFTIEEQELRLIALKSAVMKKSEARKKMKESKLTNEERPYSPTDLVEQIIEIPILTSSVDFNTDYSDDNMDISPILSPIYDYKEIDMEIVLSENSKSPINSHYNNVHNNENNLINLTNHHQNNDDINIDNVPLKQLNNNFIAIKHNLPSSTSSSPLPFIENINDVPSLPLENRITTTTKLNIPIINNNHNDENELIKLDNKKNDEHLIDISLEADCLRSLLLSNLEKNKNNNNNTKLKELPEIQLIPIINNNLNNNLITNKNNINNNNNNLSNGQEKKKIVKRNIGCDKNIPEKTTQQQVQNEQPLKDNGQNKTIDLFQQNQQLQISKQNLRNKLLLHQKNHQQRQLLLVKQLKNKAILLRQRNLLEKQRSLIPTTISTTPPPTPLSLSPKPLSIIKTASTTTTITKTLPQVISSTKLQTTTTTNDKLIKPISKLIQTTETNKIPRFIIQLSNSDDTTTDDSDNDDDHHHHHLNNKIHLIGNLKGNEKENKPDIDNNKSSTCSVTDIIDNNNHEQINDISNKSTKNCFEEKLNEFLKNARSKIDEKQTIINNNNNNNKSNDTTTITINKIQNQNNKINKVNNTPLAVRHLPPSSQMEYKKLVTRMNLLEKKKLIRHHKTTVTTTTTTTNNSNNNNLITNNISNNNNKNVRLKTTILKSTTAPVTTTTTTTTPSTTTKSPITTKTIGIVKKPNEILNQKIILTSPISPITSTSSSLSASSAALSTTTATIFSSTPVASTIKSITQKIPTKKTKFNSNEMKKTSPVVTRKLINKTRVVVELKNNIVNNNNNNNNNKNIKKLEEFDKYDKILKCLPKLTDAKKTEILNKTEKEITENSAIFLSDLDNILELIKWAQNEREKQFHIDNEIIQLKKKLNEMEKLSNGQKEILTNLFPKISSSHKIILKSRNKCSKLNQFCIKVGKIVKGDEYRLSSTQNGSILGKLKSLSTESKKLKNMKLEDVQTEKTILTPPELVQTKEESLTEKENLTTETETINLELINDNLLKPTNEINSKIKQYKSPLEYMNTEIVENPNVVLCPFDLGGKCEDEKCQYYHLQQKQQQQQQQQQKQ